MANLQGLLRWVQKLNPVQTSNGFQGHRALRFKTQEGDKTIGYVSDSFFSSLQKSKKASSLFQFEDTLRLDADKHDFDVRNKLIAEICEEQKELGVISGWRNELYPVTAAFHEQPVMLIERAAAVFFGIKAYGVHMNGYVRDGQQLKLWIAKRAKNKATFPGKLDHLCAGGQPFGLSPRENMIKECGEEAGIPKSLAEHVKPAGAVSYAYVIEGQGVKRDCLMVYDLELPQDFEPQAMDGEVESFELWEIEKVLDVISKTDDFKDNCNLVIIDFLIRHGVVQPESKEYLHIVRGLRQGDCI